MGIVYLVQPEEFLNTNVYKIGRSGVETLTRPHSGYGKNYKTIYVNNCKDEKLIENLLKYYFKNNFKLVKGLEYFEGNIEDMKQTYTYIVMEFEKTANNKILYPLNNNTKLEKNENTENIQKIENTESTDNNQIFDTTDNIAKNSKTENKESENNIENIKKILTYNDNDIKYEDLKVDFEKNNFMLDELVCFCTINRDNNIKYYNKDKFRTKNLDLRYTQIINNNGGLEKKECSFIEKWFLDKDKKKYDRIKFYPYGTQENYDYDLTFFNTFNGYDIEFLKDKTIYSYDEEDFQFILNHMRDLSNNNEDHYNYFLNYLAHIIQKPYEQPKISLIFQTKPGVGKDKFFNWFGHKIIGSKYYLNTDNIESIFGRFTSSLENKILVIMTEIESTDTFKANQKMKNFIDGDQLRIERKGETEYFTDNYGCLIGFANLDNPVKLEKDERRFVILTSSTKWITAGTDIKFKHFERLINILNSEKYNYTFYNYLKERDLTNVNLMDRPITEIYKKNAKYQSSIVGDFFANFLYSDYAKDVKNNFKEVIEYSATSLFEFFQTFNTKYGYSKNEYSMKRFSLELQNDYSDSIEKKRKSDGQHLFIKRKDLIKNLIKNNYLEKDEVDDNQVKISLFTNNK